MKKLKTKKQKISYVVQIAVFTALSVCLYFIKIPLPIFPPFLKIQFSVLPMVICGFALGPVSGVIVAVCKTLICLPITESMYVGDLADLIIESTFVLVTSLIYIKNKTKKGAIIALLFGTLSWIIMGAIINYIILVPFYINVVLKNNVMGFVNMCSIIPGITAENYRIMYVLLAALPFNSILSVLVSIITFFVYKKVSNLLKLVNDEE